MNENGQGGGKERKIRYRRVVTITGGYELRNFTVRDLIDLKGKRQLVQIMAFTPEEAAAAEAAGVDLINARWNAADPQQTVAIRRAAPRTFMTFCLPPTLASSESEALRAAFDAMEAGADGVYCAWSMQFITALAAAGVPVQGHAGLVPRKSTWTGGLRAVGGTLEQARAILAYMKHLEAAGAWSVECEVIPARVMDLLSRHTSLVTVSLGSGPGGDVQYLFAEDILGESAAAPRHARNYRNFHQKRLEMQSERIAAFREFADDVRGGAFPGPGQLVDVDESVVSGLQQLLGER